MVKLYRGNDLILGTTTDGSKVIQTADQRQQHTHVTGTSGSGKTRLLQSMIWQDVEKWPTSRFGLLSIDVDGETNPAIMAMLANRPEYWRRPIVHIDLGQADTITCINPLRLRPGDDPAVIAVSVLEAICVAFGQAHVLATPTLYRAGVSLLRALIEAKLTLAHAPLLLDSRNSSLRARVAQFVTDPIALANLARINDKSVNDKTGRQFDEETLSFANRMFAPLSTLLLKYSFGQSTASFDFDRALAEGWLVFLTLPQKGNGIAETDGRFLASMMLAELWQAARRRGKYGANEVKGFYVYVDEFQTLLTPTIAAQLSRARGYGLYFTLANQVVSQLRDLGGEAGDAIHHAAIGNTQSKIAFRASTDEDDLRPLTRALFLGQVDIGLVKDEITSHQVVAVEEVRETLYGGSTTVNSNVQRGVTHSHTDSQGEGTTDVDSYGHGTSTPEFSGAYGLDIGPSTTDSEQHASGTQNNWSSADTDGTSVLRGKGFALTESFQESIRGVPILEERVSSRTFESVENQLFQFDQMLARLPKRHAYVKLDGAERAVQIRTQDVPTPPASARQLVLCTRAASRRWSFALPLDIATTNYLDNIRHVLHPVKQIEEQLTSFARATRPARGRVKETDDVE